MNLLQIIVKILIQIGRPFLWLVKKSIDLAKKIFKIKIKIPRLKFKSKIPKFEIPRFKWRIKTNFKKNNFRINLNFLEKNRKLKTVKKGIGGLFYR